jgi:hypothetical protein
MKPVSQDAVSRPMWERYNLLKLADCEFARNANDLHNIEAVLVQGEEGARQLELLEAPQSMPEVSEPAEDDERRLDLDLTVADIEQVKDWLHGAFPNSLGRCQNLEDLMHLAEFPIEERPAMRRELHQALSLLAPVHAKRLCNLIDVSAALDRAGLPKDQIDNAKAALKKISERLKAIPLAQRLRDPKLQEFVLRAVAAPEPGRFADLFGEQWDTAVVEAMARAVKENCGESLLQLGRTLTQGRRILVERFPQHAARLFGGRLTVPVLYPDHSRIEIASLLGCTVDALYVRLKRIRDQLQPRQNLPAQAIALCVEIRTRTPAKLARCFDKFDIVMQHQKWVIGVTHDFAKTRPKRGAEDEMAWESVESFVKLLRGLGAKVQYRQFEKAVPAQPYLVLPTEGANGELTPLLATCRVEHFQLGAAAVVFPGAQEEVQHLRTAGARVFPATGIQKTPAGEWTIEAPSRVLHLQLAPQKNAKTYAKQVASWPSEKRVRAGDKQAIFLHHENDVETVTRKFVEAGAMILAPAEFAKILQR